MTTDLGPVRATRVKKIQFVLQTKKHQGENRLFSHSKQATLETLSLDSFSSGSSTSASLAATLHQVSTLQARSEYQTSLVFKRQIRVQLSNCRVIEWWSENRTEKSLIMIQNVRYSNCPPSQANVPFVFRCLVFRWLLYYSQNQNKEHLNNELLLVCYLDDQKKSIFQFMESLAFWLLVTQSMT